MNNDATQKKRQKTRHIPQWFGSVVFFIVSTAATVAGIAALVTASLIYLTQAADRVVFLGQTLPSILILDVVMVQAFIYWKQFGAMSVAIKPRLRISNVETTSFEIGRTPVFIVTLLNEGATDAVDVAIHLKAEIDPGTGTHWQQEQIVTIPAHGKREYFIRWSGTLAQDFIDALNDDKKTLQVIGSYQYAKTKPVEFRYKFWPWPWPEPRPERLPHFVPCDLVTRQAFTTTVDVATRFVLTNGSVQMAVQKNLKGNVTPSGNLELKQVKKQETEQETNDAGSKPEQTT